MLRIYELQCQNNIHVINLLVHNKNFAKHGQKQDKTNTRTKQRSQEDAYIGM